MSYLEKKGSYKIFHHPLQYISYVPKILNFHENSNKIEHFGHRINIQRPQIHKKHLHWSKYHVPFAYSFFLKACVIVN